MRRRISWLVAATTSAVVLAFVIPLCLLVRSMAADRALATGNDEARSAAILVSGLHDSPQLARLVEQVDGRSPARTTVVAQDGTTYGDPACSIEEPRANIELDLSAGELETAWVGRELHLGDAVLRVSQQPRHCLGVYADVVQPGTVEVGDEVRLV